MLTLPSLISAFSNDLSHEWFKNCHVVDAVPTMSGKLFQFSSGLTSGSRFNIFCVKKIQIKIF